LHEESYPTERISFISGSSIYQRLEGFKLALKKYNLPNKEEIVFHENLTYKEI